jgi:hypothetical protein
MAKGEQVFFPAIRTAGEAGTPLGYAGDGRQLFAKIYHEVMAQDPAKIWLRQGPQRLLDPPEIITQMEIARDLAGDDYYLSTTQRLQCNDIDETYTVVQTPGANVISIPPDAQSSGFREVTAEPTKVFDNVYYVGGMEVGSWVHHGRLLV